MIQKLRRLGDPILKMRAVPVAPDVDVSELIARMRFQVKIHDGLGLAAQQVGSTHRVSVMRLKDLENPAKWREVVAINLEILERSPEQQTSKDEGCLSAQSANGAYFRRDMQRSVWVVIRYEDEARTVHTERLTNFDAVIAQHEHDHLEGRCIADGTTREERKASFRAQKRKRRA